MSALTYIAPTKRRKMTKARRVKIFLSRNGECCVCHQQIRDGEPWDVEHPDALNLGGSDDDTDLWPVHVGKKGCHAGKTARDRKLIAKRNKAIDRGYAGKPTSRGFRRPSGTVWDWRQHRYVRIAQDQDLAAQNAVEGEKR